MTLPGCTPGAAAADGLRSHAVADGLRGDAALRSPSLPPSPWVLRFARMLPAGGSVLDVACGSGRHARWFAADGFAVTAIDRDGASLRALAAVERVAPLLADIERDRWPLFGRCFDAVVVTNYLWRPLLPTIVGSVADGGLLLYETFADGNQSVGKPSNPDFLLRPGELLRAATGLRVLAYEDGFLDAPDRFVQRIAAVRERQPASGPPPRYPL